MADRHPPKSFSPGSAAGREGNSFSDEAGEARPSAGVDRERPLDSDAKCVRTDVPERIDLLLPGESALVYQCLRDRLASLFDTPATDRKDTA